jgi:hypothetical protein
MQPNGVMLVSYQLIPQEGALQVTTSQAFTGINMAEIPELWRRFTVAEIAGSHRESPYWRVDS